MKCCRSVSGKRFFLGLGAALVVLAALAAAVRADVPAWLRTIESFSPAEGALYQEMVLGGEHFLGRRPPKQALPLLDRAVQSSPDDLELHSLRAMEEEQALNFDAAERDWQFCAAHASDRAAALFQLADFYHRRMRFRDELQVLSGVAQAPTPDSEARLAAADQSSWKAFERIFAVISADRLPVEMSDREYQSWIARYSQEPSLYGKYFEFLLQQKQFDHAEQLISEYDNTFPRDSIFPVKARALLEYHKGNLEKGLAVYDKTFQPLWPKELVDAYFGLLRETGHRQKFLDQARAALAANPDDLNAAARVFDYYVEEGKPDAAHAVLDAFRKHKEQADSEWSNNELFTMARLFEGLPDYPEAARYYYALYNSPASNDEKQDALASLIRILIVAPDQPVRLGASDLSIYKNIGTMDPGPGFLNGILSLLMNSEDPGNELASENQKAVAYFHRAEAAKLLLLFDSQFPNAPQRPELHAGLLQAYAGYGESETVIRLGQEFLTTFADAPERTQVSLMIADADVRLGKTEDEFTMYDAILENLGRKTEGIPLGTMSQGMGGHGQPYYASSDESEENESNEATDSGQESRQAAVNEAFTVVPAGSPSSAASLSAEYSQVLERYLSRLAALNQIPRALQVLRREVDRNPNDPGLYERLAQFLEQNQLGEQEEEVYQRAIQKFPDRSWYHKLARLYLRHRRNAEFEELSRQVVATFKGTELEGYFEDIGYGAGAQIYLRLNLYANHRFPHDLVFVRNLLNAYRMRETWDDAAWLALLRQHWFEDNGLRDEYLAYLSRTGTLADEAAQARASSPAMLSGNWRLAVQENPPAVQLYAETQIWSSHFENAAPALGALAEEFPADFDIARRASTVYRSLAYFDPKYTEAAVGVEQRLLESDPGNRDTLARIGDIYADRELFDKAAPYWNRMANIDPGTEAAYVEPATIFWDYFKFDDAMRLLDEGRRNVGNSSLFSYQEGAIYENERDYTRATQEYVKGAVAEGENSEAWNRLLQLAGRSNRAESADRASADAVDSSSPTIGQIRLRVSVLQAEKRDADAKLFLVDQLTRTNSLELAQEIESLAQQWNFVEVRQHALEREAALVEDPVRRLELRYALVQLYESRKDFAAAQQEIEALYRENPKILGVVRATVDFYWDRKMQQRAIDVLLTAARDSYPELREKFNFEAARKATASSNFTLARQLLDPMLRTSPYDAKLLAAEADIYARAGDESGLRDFYIGRLAQLRMDPAAPLSTVTALRRGLIPALSQLKDYTGAVDQYIEIIDRYPDDAGVTSEAALYAQKHGLERRLTDFYGKTISDSPRDVRWPIVLARIETQLENYPAAVDAFSKAIRIRPDQVDLYTSRADVCERLMQLDQAASDYSKLYELSYHDPQWMLKVAAIRAWQGRPDDAIQALKTAYLTSQRPIPTDYFSIASALESWGLVSQAQIFAQQGVELAGDDLLAKPGYLDGAKLYTRIMTQLRRQQEAYARLQKAYVVSGEFVSLGATVERFEQEGFAAVTDSQWRERERQIRATQGTSGMQACLTEMGATVRAYFTPEEKSQFAQFIPSKQAGMSAKQIESFLVTAAQAAGLLDLEANLRYQVALSDPTRSSALVKIQTQRLEFHQLGIQLEEIAGSASILQRSGILEQAAKAYRAEDDGPDELRVLAQLQSATWPTSSSNRYYELLLKYRPQELLALISDGPEWRRDSAASFAIAAGNSKFALNAVRARGIGMPPVWVNAYTGLVGLYYDDSSPSVNDSFKQILDTRTIGARLGKQDDLSQQLTGTIWFFYGSRYGEYLGTAHQAEAEDYLPASLEESPGHADAYLIPAQFYAESGDLPKAIADYRHVLELSPDRPGVLDRVAALEWKAGRKSQSVDDWKHALKVLNRQAAGAPPDSLWNDFSAVTRHLHERNLAPQFRPDLNAVLHSYVCRNGSYRAEPLLKAAFQSLDNPAAGVAWLLDVASSCPGQEQVDTFLVNAKWIPLSQLAPIYKSVLDLTQAEVAKSEEDDLERAQGTLRAWQIRWVNYLIDTKQFDLAEHELDDLSVQPSSGPLADTAFLAMRLAAAAKKIDPLLDFYRQDPEHAPQFDMLREWATQLQKTGDETAARKILEFAYSREIENRNLTAANFLGLAEIRLDSGDLSGAMALLNRLTLTVGEPFANLEGAAALLEKTGHPTEAARYLSQLVVSNPGAPEYRLRLAKAEIASGKEVDAAKSSLAALASSANVPYAVRVDAATALSGSGLNPSFGSGELSLLARGGEISVQEANQHYFASARISAAKSAANPTDQITLLRAALQESAESGDARLLLFHTAAEARLYPLAFADVQPLLPSLSQDLSLSNETDDSGSASLSSDEDVAAGPQAAGAALPALQPEGNERKARLSAEIATVMENMGQLDQAIGYLVGAGRWERSAQVRASLHRRAAELRAEIRREAENRNRLPEIHKELGQTTLVRPRLLVSAAPVDRKTKSIPGGTP